MKKLTKKSLNELSEIMPVLSEKYQKGFVGGTGIWESTPDGTNATYVNTGTGFVTGSFDDDSLTGTIGAPTGDVTGDVSGDEIALNITLPEFTVYTYDSINLVSTGINSYDNMFKAGFESGYSAGVTPTLFDDAAVNAYAVLCAAAAGSEFGGVNYDMIYFHQGLLKGLTKGQEVKELQNHQ